MLISLSLLWEHHSPSGLCQPYSAQLGRNPARSLPFWQPSRPHPPQEPDQGPAGVPLGQCWHHLTFLTLCYDRVHPCSHSGTDTVLCSFRVPQVQQGKQTSRAGPWLGAGVASLPHNCPGSPAQDGLRAFQGKSSALSTSLSGWFSHHLHHHHCLHFPWTSPVPACDIQDPR